MRFTFLAVSVLTATVPWAAVHGQSVNVDFGDAAGHPIQAYGAAGSAGTWSVVSVPPGPGDSSPPIALVGLDGRPIPATLTIGPLSDLIMVDDPGTSGDEARLLDD